MYDLWYPGLSVAPVQEAPAAGNHQGLRARTSLPTLVKHRIDQSAGSSRGREQWQNASTLNIYLGIRKVHKRPASVASKEAAPQAPAASLPEVSVGLPQESVRLGSCASQYLPTCGSVSEGIVGDCPDCTGPANDCSTSCSSSLEGTTARAGRLSVDLVAGEESPPHGHSTCGMLEHSTEGKDAKNTSLTVIKYQPFQRTKSRKEKLGEVCSSRCLRGHGPTAGVQESSTTGHTIDSVGQDNSNHRHVQNGASSSFVNGGESDCTESSKGVPVCGVESSAVLMSQLQQNPNHSNGEPDSVVETQKAAKGSQLPADKSAIRKLLSIANATNDNECVFPVSFCGWLPCEPTLQRDVIFAERKEDPAPRRGWKSSIRQKRGSMPVFRHFNTANEYMVEYREQHSFTYSTVRVYKPPPKSCCVRYTEHCSKGCEMPDSCDADHDGCALSVTFPPKAKGKNWICLAKSTAPFLSQAGSDLVLTRTCTPRSVVTGTGEEEEGEWDHDVDEATADKQGKDQRQEPCQPPAVSGKPPLSVVTEEVGHISSDISVSKYLIVHSRKDQISPRLPKPAVDQEVEEDEVGGLISHEADPSDSSIQVCDSGPSLTSESHTSLVKGKDIENVYKFPQFQPVFTLERPKKREESRAYSSKQTITSKARSLGLVSHYVLHEKKLRDLLDQCVWQERSKSCHYGRHAASREKSKTNRDNTKEPRMTPSQRGLSAAVKVYTGQMGASWATPSREKSCQSHARQYSSKRDRSATRCDRRNTSSTSRPSGASRTATTHTMPTPAPPSAINNVSATSIFLRRRSAASGRTRVLPVVPEETPPEWKGERRDGPRAKAKRLISAMPQSTPRRMY